MYVRTYHCTGWVVTADGEKSVGHSIEIIISCTLPSIAKQANRTLAVELAGCMVETVFHSLTVVQASGARVRQDAVQRASFHIANCAGSTLKATLYGQVGREKVATFAGELFKVLSLHSHGFIKNVRWCNVIKIPDNCGNVIIVIPQYCGTPFARGNHHSPPHIHPHLYTPANTK